MKIFKPIDWRRAVWNADGTRPWGRIAMTFLLLLGAQMIGIIVAIWALRGNFDIRPQLVGTVIADLLILGCALFFVSEPEK